MPHRPSQHLYSLPLSPNSSLPNIDLQSTSPTPTSFSMVPPTPLMVNATCIPLSLHLSLPLDCPHFSLLISERLLKAHFQVPPLPRSFLSNKGRAFQCPGGGICIWPMYVPPSGPFGTWAVPAFSWVWFAKFRQICLPFSSSLSYQTAMRTLHALGVNVSVQSLVILSHPASF